MHQGFFQAFAGKALARLDVGGGALIHLALAQRLEERLDGTDDLAAGGSGFEHLPQEAFKGQPQAENALAAVGACPRARQEFLGNKLTQLLQ
jgi:hypothetical protein